MSLLSLSVGVLSEYVPVRTRQWSQPHLSFSQNHIFVLTSISQSQVAKLGVLLMWECTCFTWELSRENFYFYERLTCFCCENGLRCWHSVKPIVTQSLFLKTWDFNYVGSPFLHWKVQHFQWLFFRKKCSFAEIVTIFTFENIHNCSHLIYWYAIFSKWRNCVNNSQNCTRFEARGELGCPLDLSYVDLGVTSR